MSTKRKTDSYISTSELARLLNICRQSAARLPIPRIQVGGVIRYNLNDVNQFIERNKS